MPPISRLNSQNSVSFRQEYQRQQDKLLNQAEQPSSFSQEWQQLEDEFQRKWNLLGGAPGAPIDKIITYTQGYYRAYTNGRIYLIRDQSAFFLYGDIGQKFIQLGGPQSWLGWPTSEEQDFAEGGRVVTFENGAIYWYPDTGAVDLTEVVVRYTGLFCFGETDNDGASASDEPYVQFSVVPAVPVGSYQLQTRIYGESNDPYGGVDAGDSRIDDIELYRGLPYGLSLTAVVLEHDLGDPNKFLKPTQQVVDKVGDAVAAASAAVPVIGPALAVAVELVFKEFGDEIAQAINDLFGTDDDYVGAQMFPITAKQMVALARAPQEESKGVKLHFMSPLITGDGATYGLAFTIEAV